MLSFSICVDKYALYDTPLNGENSSKEEKPRAALQLIAVAQNETRKLMRVAISFTLHQRPFQNISLFFVKGIWVRTLKKGDK